MFEKQFTLTCLPTTRQQSKWNVAIHRVMRRFDNGDRCILKDHSTGIELIDAKNKFWINKITTMICWNCFVKYFI